MNEKNAELIKLQKELKESEAEYQTDSKKWLEEKEGLLNQIREAENLFNRGMEKFAEDRQCHGKQQAEFSMKEESKTEDGGDESIPVRLEAEDNYSSSRRPSSVTSLKESEDHLETVLDSSKVSTESGKTRRFPELVVRLTRLQPDKMEIKQHGSVLPARVKMPKTRKKGKSDDMDEKSRKEYFLRKQVHTSSQRLTKKKAATLPKIGDIFQSSPIIHSKAKKLVATVSSPKSLEPESLREEEIKPKQSKRKLFN